MNNIQSNQTPYIYICPRCKAVLQTEDIRIESTDPIFPGSKLFEWKYAYTWYYCLTCLYTKNDIPF